MRALAASILPLLLTVLGATVGLVPAIAQAEAEDELNDPQPVAVPLPAGYSAPQPADGQISPGRESPATPALEAAYVFTWEHYHSLLVIGPGTGTCRPAWVVTYAGGTQDMEVAYRAVAFRDHKGVLHVDSRSALIIGPKANQWSPDSFAIFATGAVQSQDDDPEHQRESGVITRLVGTEEGAYRGLLLLAQAVVGDGT